MGATSPSASGEPSALRYVFRKDVLLRCSGIAFVVGCVLTAANQYDAAASRTVHPKAGRKDRREFFRAVRCLVHQRCNEPAKRGRAPKWGASKIGCAQSRCDGEA